MRKSVFVVLCALIVFACNHAGSPTDPSATHNTVQYIVVKSARTGQAVVGVEVRGQVDVSSSDGNGRVVFGDAANGEILVMTKIGFLTRVVNARQGMIEYLWEDDALLPYTYTYHLVYDTNNATPLRRPVARMLTVFPSAETRNDPRAWPALNWAVNLHNRTNHDIQYAIAPNDQAGVEFRIDLSKDESDQTNPGALTYSYLNGNTIVSAKIVFVSFDAFWGDHLRKAMTHELGHARGLNHGVGLGGMMGSPDPVSDFTPQEKEVMHNMFLREPGNWAPDTAPGTSARSTAIGSPIVCRMSPDLVLQ